MKMVGTLYKYASLLVLAAGGACATGCSPELAVATPSVTATNAAAAPMVLPHRGLAYRKVEKTGKDRFVAHVIEVDLTAGGMAFVTTQGDRSKGMEFIARRTSTYLDQIDALVAINASYFLPFAGGSKAGDDYYPHEGQPVNASGSVAVDNVLASPIETDLDIRVNSIVCFAALKLVIADGQTCPAGFPSGVSAGPRLLADNERRSFTAFDNSYASAAHPRTAIGVSADGRRGWLVVVDGRQEGYSIGASLDALTDLFIELGASNAINLDGGGSSALAVASAGGSPVILNRPIHTGVPGRERPVANHIALVPVTGK